jgi:hypothetical protein
MGFEVTFPAPLLGFGAVLEVAGFAGFLAAPPRSLVGVEAEGRADFCEEFLEAIEYSEMIEVFSPRLCGQRERAALHPRR